MKSFLSLILFLYVIVVGGCHKKIIPSPLPVVTTHPIDSVTFNSAISGGDVSSGGATAVLEVGICWDVNPGPTTVKDHSMDGSGTGSYKSKMKGLQPGLTYYVRAYATNASGTGYGNEIIFKSGNIWVQTPGYAGHLFATGKHLFGALVGPPWGVSHSADNASTWAMQNGINSPVTCFAASGSLLFAGTNGGTTTASSGGVYMSSDYGTTWAAVNNGLTNLSINALATIGSTVFAGTNGGVFRSTDNGSNWTAVNSGLNVLDIAAMAVKGNVLFISAGTKTFTGVYKSLNNGNIWNAASSGLPGGLSNQLNSFAVSGNNIIITGPDGWSFISADDGITWKSLYKGPSGLIYSNTFAIKGSSVYCADRGVASSKDNGATWAEYDAGLPYNFYSTSVALNDSYLFVSSTQGVYRLGL